MISSQELRIWNWVNLDVVPYQITEIKQECISANYYPNKEITLGTQYYVSENDIPYDTLFPIPIIEDILLKCGFKWNDLARCYQDDHMIELVNEEGINPNYFIWHNNGMVGRNPMHYLHQLQNLYFALVGKELNVKL